MRIVFALSVVLALVASAPQFHAQVAADATPKPETKNKRTLVKVPVVVSDREGHYVAGLRKEDFTIFQNGERLEIASFGVEEEPIKIALLIDTSQSTERVLPQIKEAARDFIGRLNPRDECLLATFDYRVNVLSQFSGDHRALERAVDEIRIADRSGTVMRRAVSHLIKTSFAQATGRKAMIVLTDGKDFGSYMTKPELLDLLQESDIMIYTIFFKTGLDFVNPDGSVKDASAVSLPPAKKPKKKKNAYQIEIPMGDFPTEEEVKERERRDDIEAIDALKKMADITSGRFYLKDVGNLKSIFGQVTDELRQQYRIGFYTTDAGGAKAAVQDLKIKVERPDLVARTRAEFRPDVLEQ